MDATAIDDRVLRNYLLGASVAEVQHSVERRLFSDDRIFWEHLCLVEDELIDDFVSDRLDPEEAQRFEQCFLSTEERRRKLDLARSLWVYVNTQVSAGPARAHRRGRVLFRPAWAVAAAATLLLMLPAAAWRFASTGPSQDEVSARLTSGLIRSIGGELVRVRIPSGTKLVRFYLDTDATLYPRYRATLHEAGGSELWSQNDLRAVSGAGAASVTLVLPSEVLQGGDYYVRLRGVSPDGGLVLLHRYDFRVITE